MRIAVSYGDGRLEFELEDDRVIAHRDAPGVTPAPDVPVLIREALEAPREFPPLARAIVPGDRVVIPFDADLPEGPTILAAVAATLRGAGAESIAVVSTAPPPDTSPEGVTWRTHDPDDRDQNAYLASTQEGRRIYLDKLLTDADIVIPIGTLGYDPSLGYRGPWSVIYPGLSDREALARTRSAGVADASPDGDGEAEGDRPGLLESAEVSWLLGCQFQVGILPAAGGATRVVAGLESAVRSEGAAAVDAAWSFRADERADVVVVGIGPPGRPSTLDELAGGLATAARLVRRGGKIVALARTAGEVGPAVRRLAGAENPRAALNRLRGHEADPDYPAARQIAAVLAWADVYLHSGLDLEVVDDLGIVPLDRPEEARKLAAAAASCTLLSHADRTRAVVPEER